MMQVVIGGPDAPLTWLDLIQPTREELTQLAATYGLHLTSVEDSLEPEHLPKHELIADARFVILRAYDEAASAEAVTTRQLTRKLALFIGGKTLITIHRQDQPFIARLRSGWAVRPLKAHSLPHVVNDLVRGVVDSYVKPLAAAHDELTAMEAKIFGAASGDHVLSDGYRLRRRATVFRHMLRLTRDIIAELALLPKASRPFFQDLKETCDRLLFGADDLLDSTDHMMSLHLAIAAEQTGRASHRTNEVMRLLTVFSAFFLPLNFIASIYGMNFEHMPELRNPYGYYATLGIMAAVATGILVWVKRRGWLRAADD